MRSPLWPMLLLWATGCASNPTELGLSVTWKFVTGDCASNDATVVRLTMTGSLARMAEFACPVGEGKLGELSKEPAAYRVTADGLDAAGTARFTHAVNLVGGESDAPFARIDFRLRPAADVFVNWNTATGDGCRPSVQPIYRIILFRGSTDAGRSSFVTVTYLEEKCSTRTATFEDIAPGDYVVELRDQAVSPNIVGEKDVTILRGGENATVDFQF